MKSIITLCCLFAIGCTNHGELASLKSSLRTSGETIVAKQDESLGILRENTNALAAIKDQIDTLNASQSQSEPGNGKECDLESDPPPNVKAVVNESHASSPGMQPVKASAVELFVCSTASCAPCKRMWRDVDDGKLDGFVLTKVPAFNGLKSYPAIRFANPDSDTGWSVVYGYDEDTRLWLRAKLLGEKPVASSDVDCEPVIVSHSRYANPVLSHGEMVAIHNSIHGGGQWNWPGDLAAHLQSVHGVVTSGGAPGTGAFFPLQRQSAVTSSRSVIRSNSWGQGFVGRSRVISR